MLFACAALSLLGSNPRESRQDGAIIVITFDDGPSSYRSKRAAERLVELLPKERRFVGRRPVLLGEYVFMRLGKYQEYELNYERAHALAHRPPRRLGRSGYGNVQSKHRR